MAKITISGMENEKNTAVGTNGGNSGTGTGTSTGTSTSAGTTAGNTNDSTTVKGSFSSLWGSGYPISENNQSNIQLGTSINENQQKAEKSLEQLKNDYSKKLLENYEYLTEKLKGERDEALRENWILQQKAEAALPEQMAAAGINGGASETTLANLRARYQGNRDDIRKVYVNNLGELAQQHISDEAQTQRKYNERWIDYLLSLAEMEEQRKYVL